MKPIQKGATKRLAYGGLVIIFVLAMAVLASSSFITQNPEPAQVSKGLTDPHDTGGGDRDNPCTPLGGTKCGKIIIRKDAGPDSYQDFYFTHNIPGYNSPFMLDDDATLPNPSSLSFVRTFYTPENGNFTVSEQLTPQVWNPQTNQYEGGYNVSISCIDTFGGTTTTQATANISIYQGGTVTCTFKNTPMAPTQVCLPHNSWSQKANVGGFSRVSAFGFSVGGKGYIGGGSGDGSAFSDFWEYSPASNTWTQKMDFGGGVRNNAVGFSIGTKGYAGTGEGQPYWDPGLNTFVNLYSDFWEYNPGSNTWTQKMDFGGGQRTTAVGFSIGSSRGYIGTGYHYNASTYFQDFWEYNPGLDTWTQKANFGGGARQKPVGFGTATRGYVGLGGPNMNSDFWEYTPGSGFMGGTWTQKASFTGGPRTQAVGFSMGNKGYVGTGSNNGTVFQDFREYTPGPGFMGGTWTPKANLGGVGRNNAVGFSIGPKGYIGTGTSTDWYNGLQDFWEYCP